MHLGIQALCYCTTCALNEAAHRWRCGWQYYAPAAPLPPGRFLALISVAFLHRVYNNLSSSVLMQSVIKKLRKQIIYWFRRFHPILNASILHYDVSKQIWQKIFRPDRLLICIWRSYLPSAEHIGFFPPRDLTNERGFSMRFNEWPTEWILGPLQNGVHSASWVQLRSYLIEK
jgi:hypothetical protein